VDKELKFLNLEVSFQSLSRTEYYQNSHKMRVLDDTITDKGPFEDFGHP
jgi:hypothetical protein